MAYLYRHIRLDKNEVFYIGIGSDPSYKRANCKHKRSDHWNRIVKNTSIEIEIILDDLSWEEACKKEIEFIALYGRRNNKTGTLVNLTDGGEGSLGVIFSNETLQKRSIALSGCNNPMYGRNVSKEYGDKISKTLTGKKQSDFTKQKRAKALSKKVINTVTGEIFNSINEAGQFYKIKYCTLSRYLSGYTVNKTSLKLL